MSKKLKLFDNEKGPSIIWCVDVKEIETIRQRGSRKRRKSQEEVSSILIHLYSYFDFVDNSHVGVSESTPCFWQAMKATAFSDKQRRCDKCNTFLSKDNHQFCGTCINCITESQGTNETRSNAERSSNEEVIKLKQ
jgi:hypothetical protein